ncbi:MAG: NAD-glutamate dehydrogenase [Hyphomicrobiales bacterium]|nr:NAD-glutamate dehydrogenase [Hyphomicrobiales bacterium]
MATSRQQTNRQLTAVRKALAKRSSTTDTNILSALAGDLFDQVSPEDLDVYSPDALATLVLSAYDLATTRRPNQAIVRLVDPDDGDPTTSSVTLVEMLNRDMPFLVDSALIELQRFGAEVKLVAHPILRISRNKSGKLETYGANKGQRESLIQIHIDRIAGVEDRNRLKKRLESLLVEIRLAVTDWQAMRDRLGAITEQYRTQPIPVPEHERQEAIAFLDWLADDNFTFLGVRHYDYSGGTSRGRLRRSETGGLGILANPTVRILTRGRKGMTITPQIRAFLMRAEPLIVTKSNLKSRIHRNTHADYIGAKSYHEDGRLAGETRFIGLFNSTAYNRSVLNIPFLRGKVEATVDRAGFPPNGHSAKALINVLESYPRDELFQTDLDHLFRAAIAIMALAIRPRIRVLTRRDRFDRFVSILVFVPRDRFDDTAQERIGAFLAEAFDGRVSAFYLTFTAGTLTRIQYIIGRDSGKTPNPDQASLEAAVASIVERWSDALRRALAARHPQATAAELFSRYGKAFSVAYHEATPVDIAVDDIEAVEGCTDARPLIGRFHPVPGASPETIGLKLSHIGAPVPLSERVPVLENMGLKVIDEHTFDVTPAGDRRPIFIHDMVLEHAHCRAIQLESVDAALIESFLAVWEGVAENDGYNALVIDAGFTWRQVAILRAASRFIRQSGTPFTNVYMWQTLNRHAEIARALVDLFLARFDADQPDERLARRRVAKIEAALETVQSLDEDRIIRLFLSVFDAILRTNYFQRDVDGRPPSTITFKIDSRRLDFLPAPRPLREIYVYSPRVEGVHLRFGLVARGGLRWSDRPLDFRTEILGLARAQEAKNAVIVPHGAKGGFVPRRLPDGNDRNAVIAEGTAAYRIFVSSLLDLTDNLDGDKTVPPPNVLVRDGNDPYLVVAADKGTATFSDIANEIAEARDFWLDDAFASGGSHGYDHKKMGITARGAWESVKRHFRETDIDIQTTPFTVVGVGDMSGDVFGNGMLLSKQIRLVAAFDHRDIFIDPDPDPAVSYRERKRLFKMPRSTWRDYDRTGISRGGGVFSRSDKAIPLSPQIRQALDLDGKTAAPNDVLRAILLARADLLFFGGIGTYVRGATETNDQVGDRANDPIRVTGSALRARVIGEGGNLGMTQPARVEFALAGGRCNTDAIDNSAGVNTSDVEVNIKIALGRAIRDGRLGMKRRDKLLASMTGEVAALVLRNNYLQTLAISLIESRGFSVFAFQRRLIQDLERRGRLDRSVESLPDDVGLDERQAAGKPLTRPEIAVLIAYAKIAMFDALTTGKVADHTTLSSELLRYFPQTMREQFGAEIQEHRLCEEIIATQVANSIINRAGPAFVIRAADRTGASSTDIARAYVAVRDVFGLRSLNGAIDRLDNRIAGAVQLDLYRAVQDLTQSRTMWFLRNVPLAGGTLGQVADEYRASTTMLADRLDDLLPDHSKALLADSIQSYKDAGVPEPLTNQVARLRFLAQATDIHLVAEASGHSFDDAADAYYALARRFRIDQTVRSAAALPTPDYYDGLARDRALETLSGAHRQLAVNLLAVGSLEGWEEANRVALDRGADIVASMVESMEMTLSRIIVVSNLLADIAGG